MKTLHNSIKIYFVILVTSLCLSCAKPEIVYQTEYKEVLIPTACSISIPTRPTVTSNQEFLTTVNNLLKYIEELETTVMFCVGDTNETKR